MTKGSQIEYQRECLAHALKDLTLRVPRYQRSYAWKSENVLEFIEDIGAAMAAGDAEYFLGSIVVASGDGAHEVVDGQQRLATTSLFIAAVRDALIDLGEAEQAADLARDFLATRHRRTRELEPKLQLNELDHEFYRSTVLSDPSDPARSMTSKRLSHERIRAAKKACDEKVCAIVATAGPAAAVDRLMDWVEYFENSARVIWVSVPDHANAFTIFETLNDRGLDLSIADLLKNYLFGRSGDRIDEVQGCWERMLGVLESAGGEDLVTGFLRHLWASSHGPVRERELYAQIKRGIRNVQAAVDFAVSLEHSSKFYAAIVNPRDRRWRSYGGSARGHIEALGYLRMEQFRPLLLAVMTNLANTEVRKVLRYLVSASVRFLVVGGLGGGTMEKTYSGTAKMVSAHKLTTANAIAKELSKKVPKDSEFQAAFERVKVSQSFLARYYLRALERTSLGEKEPEFVPNENEDEVNLEHILPQKPSSAWKLSDDLALAYYQRLGNLALMQAKPNRDAGNKGFKEKKKYYKKSKLTFTNSIASESDWGPTQIEDRQKRLAAFAPTAWGLKVRA